MEAGCGLRSSFWKNLSYDWGDLPLVLFQKSKMFRRGRARRIAGRGSYGRLLPPLGQPPGGKRPHREERAGAAPGPSIPPARGPFLRAPPALARSGQQVRPRAQSRLPLSAGRHSAEQNLPPECSSCC